MKEAAVDPLPERPAWPWRLLAYTILVVAGLMSLPTVLRLGAMAWLFAIPTWLAIGGTLAYAHGWRARPLWFWRIFALCFSLYTMATLGRLFGRFAATARDAPEGLTLVDWIILSLTLPLCSLVCVALLRHAELLRARQRRMAKMYGRIFA